MRAHELRTSGPVALGTAGVLLVLHRRLWRKDPLWSQPHGRVWAYVLGCGVLWVGFSAWCGLTGNRAAWRAYSLLLAGSGATVLAAWIERAMAARWQDWTLFMHAGRLARKGGPAA
jgi:hypothetical protein